jgi:hypothetical protein
MELQRTTNARFAPSGGSTGAKCARQAKGQGLANLPPTAILFTLFPLTKHSTKRIRTHILRRKEMDAPHTAVNPHIPKSQSYTCPVSQTRPSTLSHRRRRFTGGTPLRAPTGGKPLSSLSFHLIRKRHGGRVGNHDCNHF